MFDLKESVTYRGYDLNGGARNGPGGPFVGSMLDQLDWRSVRGVGYSEKRARGDGNDATDVYLAARQFVLTGTVYGATRGDSFDQWLALTAALTPTLAYDDDVDGHGYLPLAFSQPTALTEDFESGVRAMQLLIRPMGTPATIQGRDTSGGDDAEGFGIRWSCQVEAKDPRLYLVAETSEALGSSGDLANRGTYKTPITLTIVAASTLTSVRFVGCGADMTITMDGAVAQTLEWDGDRQMLFRTVSGVTTPRPDLVTHNAETTYPIVPPGGGSYEVFTTGTVGASTITATYHEAWI